MKLLSVLAFALLAAPVPAHATFSSAELEAISAALPPAAALPVELRFVDESGRSTTLASVIGDAPSIVIFADYTCRTLCGPILDFAVAGLTSSGLRPGVDFRLLVIGLDPNDDLGAARMMRSSHLDAGTSIAAATTFLTGTGEAIRSATGALGYHYAYDFGHDQFAHPAAVYVVDTRGHIIRVLSGLGLSGNDLRMALVEAGGGAVGTLGDQIHLLCYGYDPVRGIYTERITLSLEIAAAATLIFLIGGILAALAFERWNTRA